MCFNDKTSTFYGVMVIMLLNLIQLTSGSVNSRKHLNFILRLC